MRVEYIHNKYSPLTYHQLVKRLSPHTSSRHRATWSFIRSNVCVHLMNPSPIFSLFYFCFWSPPPPEKISGSAKCFTVFDDENSWQLLLEILRPNTQCTQMMLACLLIVCYLLCFLQRGQETRRAGRSVWVWRDWPWSCTASQTSGCSGVKTNASSNSSGFRTSSSPSASRYKHAAVEDVCDLHSEWTVFWHVKGWLGAVRANGDQSRAWKIILNSRYAYLLFPERSTESHGLPQSTKANIWTWLVFFFGIKWVYLTPDL